MHSTTVILHISPSQHLPLPLDFLSCLPLLIIFPSCFLLSLLHTAIFFYQRIASSSSLPCCIHFSPHISLTLCSLSLSLSLTLLRVLKGEKFFLSFSLSLPLSSPHNSLSLSLSPRGEFISALLHHLHFSQCLSLSPFLSLSLSCDGK